MAAVRVLPGKSEVEGRAYSLSAVEESDAEFILELRGSDRARGRLHPIAGDIAWQRSWIRDQRRREGDYYFTIRERIGRSSVGLIGLYRIDRTASTGEWGRWVLLKGSPAAPESAYLVLRFGFEELGLSRITSRTVASNRDVIAFHQSLGLGEGVLRPGCFEFDGVRIDAVEHVVTDDIWPDVKVRLQRASNRVADALSRRLSSDRGRDG